MAFARPLARAWVRTFLAGAAGLLAAGGAAAQDKWPSRPITYVVPFGAGGTTDILARIIGPRLSSAIGQPVVVDNKPGAGGNVGSDFVARAAPDGYTILGGTISSHAINVSLYPKMPYDPVKNFQPITLIGLLPNVLVVNASSPYKSVADLIAAGRAKPDALSFASSGNGTSQHLSAELFKNMSGAQMLHVPFKSSAQAVQALLGEQVNLVFENILAAIPQIQAGKFRALAVTSSKRSAMLPDVPTMAEAGLKGYEIVSWQGIFGPAGMPPQVTQRLSSELGKIIAEPEVKARLQALGVEPSGIGPAEFSAFQKAEVQKWAALIKSAQIKSE